MTKLAENNLQGTANIDDDRVLGVVYIVNRVDDGEHSYTSIEMVFSSKEKAEIHKQKLEEKYMDSIGFKYKHFYFEIDEECVF